MDENDSSDALRDPLLPLTGDNDENEEEYPQRFFPNEELGGEDAYSSFSRHSYPTEWIQMAESNVRKSLAIVFCDLATQSIWSPNILSIFCFLVWYNSECYHPGYIGIVQALTGIFQTMMWSTSQHDICGANLVKLASTAGLFAIIMSVVSISIIGQWWESNDVVQFVAGSKLDIICFLVANGLWGIFWGILETALPNVFVESLSVLPEPKKQQIANWHDRLPLGGAFGNVLAIVIFYKLGNEWTIPNCIVVLICGLACNLCGVLALCCIKPISFDEDDENWMDAEIGEDYVYVGDFTEAEVSDLVEEDESLLVDDEATEEGESVTLSSAQNLLVPALIHLSDVVSSIAGGISAWYFPLFLWVTVDVSPILLLLFCLAIPMGQKLSVYFATTLARCVGPSRTCILLQWMHAGLLYFMVDSRERRYHSWMIYAFYALYFLHGSLMNSTSSLTTGMIETHVPFEEQHLWSWVQTPQKLLWSCSGFLGAWLATQSEILFQSNVYFTALLQFLASFPLVVLYCLRDPPLEKEQDGDSLYHDCASGDEMENINGISGPETGKNSSPPTPATELAESDYDESESSGHYHDAQTTTTWVV